MANPTQAFPKTATGTILLRGGKLELDVNPLRVAAGGDLQFQTAPGSPLKWWAILWLDETPFTDGSGGCQGKHGHPNGKPIGAGANGGGQNEWEYKYAVVASDGQKVHFLDPEVVVGPDDGGS